MQSCKFFAKTINSSFWQSYILTTKSSSCLTITPFLISPKGERLLWRVGKGVLKFANELDYLCIMIKAINSILSFLLAIPVLLYRYTISPLLPAVCRHEPSCSQFMLDALKMHGPFIGLVLGTGRILRCRPGGTHGYDPVPLFIFKRYRPLFFSFKRFEKDNRLKR
jgi:hypothetical protein